MAKKEKDMFEMLDEMTTRGKKPREAEVGIKLLELLATSARAGEFDEGIKGYIIDTHPINVDITKFPLIFRAAIVDFLECRKIELEEAFKK